jgi:hypothetical protein
MNTFQFYLIAIPSALIIAAPLAIASLFVWGG